MKADKGEQEVRRESVKRETEVDGERNGVHAVKREGVRVEVEGERNEM